MNETVGMKNCLMMSEENKRLVLPFRRQEFWKCIGYVLSSVTCGKKGHNIWSEIPKYFGNKTPTKPQKYVCGNTDLYKVCCDFYRPFYIYDCH